MSPCSLPDLDCLAGMGHFIMFIDDTVWEPDMEACVELVGATKCYKNGPSSRNS